MDNDLSFGDPQFARSAGGHFVGVKTTEVDGKLKWVAADYFTPGFGVATVSYDKESGLVFPEDFENLFLADEKSAPFDGANHVNLWSSTSPEHTNTRAQAGQLSSEGGTLYFIQNGAQEIGRYRFVSGKVESPLTRSVGNRIEDFLFIPNGNLVTIEVDDKNKMNDSWILRTYKLAGDTMELKDQSPLGSPFMYGLCELGDRVLMVAPWAKTHPGEARMAAGPGVYSTSVDAMGNLGEVVKDERFPNLPGDARSLAKVSLDGQLNGMAVTTFGYNRGKPMSGESTNVYVMPALKES